MPESAQDKSEAPTPERKRKARQEGQVAQSQEVPSAIITAGLLLVLAMTAPALLAFFKACVVECIVLGGRGGLSSGETFREIMRRQIAGSLWKLMPFFVVFGVLSCFSSILVGGLNFSPKALKFDLKRLHPANGIKEIVSAKSLVKLLLSLVKMIFLGVISYVYIRAHIEELLALRWASPYRAMTLMAGLLLGLMIRVCVGLAIIALVDYAWQKYHHWKKLHMTKKEVKEEQKQYELAPEVRGKIRQIQYEMSQRRMLQDVPTADVVVTNPTHFAVALKYDQQNMAAPIVVAKGPDHLAQKIKEIAREHNVPIVEKPELARALYRSVEIGRPVPSDLFVAVAEVMAMIYRLRQKRKRARQ